MFFELQILMRKNEIFLSVQLRAQDSWPQSRGIVKGNWFSPKRKEVKEAETGGIARA